MAMKVQCPGCDAILSAQSGLSHKRMKCPKCGTRFQAIPIDEVKHARREAANKMVEVRKRLEARKAVREKPGKEPEKGSAQVEEPAKEGPRTGREQKLWQFKSFEEFMSWWDSPEIEEWRLQHPEAVVRLMGHQFVKPWIEQLLAKTGDASTASLPAAKVPTEEDRVFASFLVKYGLLPKEKVQDVLALQKRLAQEGQIMSLGGLTVLKGYVTARDVKATLKLSKAAKQRYSDTHYAPTAATPSSGRKAAGWTVPDSTLGPLCSQTVSSAEETGEEFGKYRLLGELGHGGMGIVYKAFDTELKRTVALKMLLCEESGVETQQVKRFMIEARAAAKLKHPNIVQLHDFGEEYGRHYFTMDYVEGISLEDALADRKRQRLSPKRISEIIRDVADALGYAHSKGIIHRDIKPANILLDRDGKPFLTDFGLAKEVRGLEKSLTLTGVIMGTPYYMSPEQARGDKRIDRRSDIFSLGVIMYEALTGRKPFAGTQIYEILNKVIDTDPPTLRSVSRLVHRDIETICMKCLDKEKQRRYRSAKELSDDITRYLEGEPILARPSGLPTKIWKKAKKNRITSVSIAATAAIFLIVIMSLLVSSARTSAKIEVYMRQAQEEFDERNFADARALCEKILELSPGDRTAEELRRKCISEIARLDEESRRERETALALVRQKTQAQEIRARAQAIIDRLKSTRTPWERITACDEALEIDPTFGLAWQEKGYAYKELRDYDKAFECFTKAIGLTPQLAYSYYERAWITQSVRKKLEDAVPDFEKVIQLDPGSHIAHFSKGYVEALRRNYDAAIAHYTKAIEIFPQYDTAYHDRGYARQQKGDLDGAIEDYSKAIEIDPTLIMAYLNRGNARSAKNDLDGAVADYEKVIEIDPKNAGAYCNRGNVRARKGNHSGAVADYSKAIKLDPELAEAYYSRGLHSYHRGDIDKAIADWTKAIEIKPDYAHAYYNRGVARKSKDDTEGALADYEKAIQADPYFPAPYLNRGRIREENGDLDGAVADYDKIIEINPNHARAYINRGAVRSQKGDLDGAIADCTKSIEIEPGDARAYLNRGVAWHRKGNLKGAIEDYTKAIEINPLFTLAYTNRGVARDTSGDLKGAIEDFEQLLKMAPNDPQAHEIKKRIAALKKKLNE